jgi:hypothetical protein
VADEARLLPRHHVDQVVGAAERAPVREVGDGPERRVLVVGEVREGRAARHDERVVAGGVERLLGLGLEPLRVGREKIREIHVATHHKALSHARTTAFRKRTARGSRRFATSGPSYTKATPSRTRAPGTALDRRWACATRPSLAAALTLGVAIGAAGAVFSGLHALLAEPHGYADARRVCLLRAWDETRNRETFNLPLAAFVALGPEAPSFERLAAYRYWSAGLAGTTPQRVSAYRVTADTFPLLGTAPLLGATLEARDARPGAAKVAVLSHALLAAALRRCARRPRPGDPARRRAAHDRGRDAEALRVPGRQLQGRAVDSARGGRGRGAPGSRGGGLGGRDRPPARGAFDAGRRKPRRVRRSAATPRRIPPPSARSACA